MTEGEDRLNRVHARVLADPRPGFVNLLLYPDLAFIGGGIRKQVPESLVPEDCRAPLTNVWVVVDQDDVTAVERGNWGEGE